MSDEVSSTQVEEGSEPEVPTPDAPEVDEVARLTAERDEYLDLAQRVQAEFDNYRKRALRDQERLVAHAHERLVRELLPVLDDLERALEAADEHEEAKVVEGVKLVEQALRGALAKEGLAEISTDGPFDPHVHEALLDETRRGRGARVRPRGRAARLPPRRQGRPARAGDRRGMKAKG